MIQLSLCSYVCKVNSFVSYVMHKSVIVLLFYLKNCANVLSIPALNDLVSLHFSTSRHDNHEVDRHRSRTDHQKRHLSSSSSRSSSRSPTAHKRRRSTPLYATWVPADTSRTNLSHLVGSSKFATSRAYDDSRVNPERARNLSDSTAGEMFGPTLPPSAPVEGTEIHQKRSSTSDSSDAEKHESKSRRRRTSNDEQHPARKRAGRDGERQSIPRNSTTHRRKVSASQDLSSSRSRSYSSATSSSPGSRSGQKKLPRTNRRSSFSASRSKQRIPSKQRRRSSSSSRSGRKAARKQARHSSSSSSRSDSSDSSAQHTKESSGVKSKNRLKAQTGHRRDRQGFRRDSYAEHETRRYHGAEDRNLSFSGRRKSRSISQNRSKKPMSAQTNRFVHKGETDDRRLQNNSVHREAARTEGVGGIPIANYSSSDSDERTRTPQNKSDVAGKSSVVERKVSDSKQQTSVGLGSTATAVASCDKNADSGKTTTDDKPKETLADMELFLKQLKANKQQQMLKK